VAFLDLKGAVETGARRNDSQRPQRLRHPPYRSESQPPFSLFRMPHPARTVRPPSVAALRSAATDSRKTCGHCGIIAQSVSLSKCFLAASSLRCVYVLRAPPRNGEIHLLDGAGTAMPQAAPSPGRFSRSAAIRLRVIRDARRSYTSVPRTSTSRFRRFDHPSGVSGQAAFGGFRLSTEHMCMSRFAGQRISRDSLFTATRLPCRDG